MPAGRQRSQTAVRLCQGPEGQALPAAISDFDANVPALGLAPQGRARDPETRHQNFSGLGRETKLIATERGDQQIDSGSSDSRVAFAHATPLRNVIHQV